MDSLQVEVDVSETSITLIRVGQPCDIQLDALSRKAFPRVVHAVVPTVDRSKATVLVKVRFLDKDARMLPDMSAKVAFLSRELAAVELAPRLAATPPQLLSERKKRRLSVLDNKVRETSSNSAGSWAICAKFWRGKAGDRCSAQAPGLKDGSRIQVAER
jgi:hypothetical protein